MREIQPVNFQTSQPKNFNSPNVRRTIATGSDEIDLMEMLAYLVDTIKKYRTVILSTIAICLIASFVVYKFLPPVYERDLVLAVPLVEKSAFEKVIADFEYSARQAQDRPLNAIKSIELVGEESSDKETAAYTVSMRISDPSVASEIQQQMVSHVEDNAYVKQKSAAEIATMNKMIQELQRNENRIASVLDVATKTNVNSESISIADLSKLQMDFYKQRIELQSKIDNYSPVEIIQPLTGSNRPENKSILKYVGISFVASLLLAGVIVAMLEISSKIKRYQRPKPQGERKRVNLTLADR